MAIVANTADGVRTAESLAVHHGGSTKSPPAPRLPGTILGLDFLFREERVIERYHRRYGDIFAIPIPGFPLVVVADPAEIKRIFTGSPEQLHPGEANESVRVLLGDHSVLLLDEESHLHQRKLLLPPFHGQRISAYEPIIAAIADAEIDTWTLGTPFPALPSMQSITMRVILRAVFGVEDPERSVAFERALRAIFSPMTNPLTAALATVPEFRRDVGPLRMWSRFLAARDAVDELIYEQIARHRTRCDLAQRDDVLALMLQTRDENGGPISDVALRDELVTLLVAGYETTSSALSWALERIVRHPEVLARLQAEITNHDDRYLDCAIKESLRSRPPIHFALRRLTTSLPVGPYLAPAGWNLAASTWLIHHRPDLYPNPKRFRPERFEQSGADTYTWIPFGGGVRRCIGAGFATFEIKIVLRRIIERCRLAPLTTPPERPRRRAITFVPHAGAKITIQTRQ